MKNSNKIGRKITAITTGLFTVTTGFLLAPSMVIAQITNPVTGSLGDDAEKAASGETFVSYFVSLWNTIISVGGIIVLVNFLWGALEWITAGGDASKIEKARNKIVQSVIGLLILVSSFVIIGFISELFFGEDFSILNLSFTRVGGEE